MSAVTLNTQSIAHLSPIMKGTFDDDDDVDDDDQEFDDDLSTLEAMLELQKIQNANAEG